MGVYTEAVQQLYVAYFSRPADTAGLHYWEGVIAAAGGNTAAVSAAFAASDEYQAMFAGQNAYQIVATIYQNLFGREVEPAGLTFWGRALMTGSVTIDQAVAVIASAAQGTDATAYANKAAAATAFTAALNTSSAILGYAGASANAQARAWLAGITDDASLASATEAGALAATVGTIADTGLSAVGKELTLTTGIDTLTGGANNDTFIAVVDNATAANTTLTNLDVLDGGAGSDTLRIDALSNLTGVNAVTVTNIENVVVRGAGSIDLDVQAWTGVENLRVTEANGDVTLSAGNATNVGVGYDVKGSSDVTVNGAKDVNVKLANVGEDTAIDVRASGAVNIEVTGRAAILGDAEFDDITVHGGSSVTVTQNATSSTSGLKDEVIIEQGDVYVYGAANTTSVTVTQSIEAYGHAAIEAVPAVAEATTLKFSALAAGEYVEVDGLVFHAARSLSAAEVANAFANLGEHALEMLGSTQGAGLAVNGYYTGKLAGWTTGAAEGDTVTFVSTTEGNPTDLAYSGAAVTLVNTVQGAYTKGREAQLGVVAGDVTINDGGNSIETVTLNGFRYVELENGFAKLGTLNLSNAVGYVNVEDSASALTVNMHNFGIVPDGASVPPLLMGMMSISTDISWLEFTHAPTTLHLNIDAANNVDLRANATETLTISGNGTLLLTAEMDSVKTVTVSGATSVYFERTLLPAATFDASATSGNIVAAIRGDVTTYTGATGADEITVDATTAIISKDIKLGAGDDVLDLSELSATVLAKTTGKLEGGSGTDTLVLGAQAADTLSKSAAFEGKFAGFEKLGIGELYQDATVDLDNLDDINYVIVNGVSQTPPDLVRTTVPGSYNTYATLKLVMPQLENGQSITFLGRTVTATAALAPADVAMAFINGSSVNATVTPASPLTGWSANSSDDAAAVLFMSESFGAIDPLPVATTAGSGAPAAPVAAVVHPGSVAQFEQHDFTVPALSAGQRVQIDRISVVALEDVTAEEVAAAFESGVSTTALAVDTGGGSSSWTVAAIGDVVRFTSTTVGPAFIPWYGASGAATGTLTLDNLAADATVELNNDNDLVINFKDASGTADVLNLVANDDALADVTISGVETINVRAPGNGGEAGLGLPMSGELILHAKGTTTVNLSVDEDWAYTVELGSDTKSVTLVDGSQAQGSVILIGAAESDAVAVTLKGGAGDDALIALGDKADILIGGAGNDTLIAGRGLAKLTGGEGSDVFGINQAAVSLNSYATIMDFTAEDMIVLMGVESFNALQITLADTAVFQDYANAAVNALAENAAGWFIFEGNTYLVADMDGDSTAGFVDGKDYVVKLVGEIDLSQASFNADLGSIALV